MDEDFEAYVGAHARGLLRLAYLLTADSHLAEDLVQEALTRAHHRWARIQQVQNPHAYVRRIVVNQHTSWRRKRSSSEVPTSPADLAPGRSVAADEAVTDRDLAWGLLQQLPARQRAVLVLRYYEDLPDSEIAEVLGVAEGTVRSLASRAFATMRQHPALAEYGPSPFASSTAGIFGLPRRDDEQL